MLGNGVALTKNSGIFLPIIPASCRTSATLVQHGAKIGSSNYLLEQKMTNGSFESDLTGWTRFATSNGTYEISETQKKYGDKALKITAASKLEAWYVNVAAANGDIVYARAWCYLESGSLSPSIFGYLDNESVYFSTSASLSATLGAYWAAGSNTWTVSSAGFSLRIGRTSSQNATYYIDGVMILNLTSIFGRGNEPNKTEIDDILIQNGETNWWSSSSTVNCNPSRKYYDYDYSGNSRHLAMNNYAYTTASGWNGNFLVFDGTDDYETRTLTATITAGTSYSVGIVLNMTGNKTAMTLHTSTTAALTIGLNASGFSSIQGYKDDGTYYTALGTTDYRNTNTFIVATVDNTANVINLYENGNPITSVATAATMRGFATINIGANAAVSAYTALSRGMVFIHTAVLTATEVKAYYKGNKRYFGM